MKLLSKNLVLIGIGFLLATGGGVASTRADLFSTVPAGDSTYQQLDQLEKAGLLESGNSNGPLTRFEVAKRIFKAEQKYKEIVVAQADMDLPPPPPDENGAAGGTAASTGTSGEEAKGAAGPSTWNDPKKIAEAEKNLKSLKEAYDFELGLVKEQKSSVEDEVSKTEAAQYDLWKSVKGILEYPSVSIHGVGEGFFVSQQYSGNSGMSFPQPASRFGWAYLDLRPTGSISKEIRWDAIFRFDSNMLPIVGNDGFVTRWLSAEFSPDFMSSSLGDFYEAYTPFTLWNRNNLDLFYKPEMMARQDDYYKSETFSHQEPAWPFRGLRLGTAIGWPDSNLVEQFKISTFAHMIRNGFGDPSGWFLGPTLFTDWVFAGTSELKLKKWYLGGTSWQLITDIYGVVLDEPLDTNTPGSPYSVYNPSTWAHQYLIGSFHPTLRVGLGEDIYAGGQYEGAFASYQDDKKDNSKIVSDYAMNVGAFFQAGDSKISFNYIDVGPSYYSPLAQTRQDSVTLAFGPSNVTFPSYYPSPWLYLPYFPSQYFLSNVPRASGIFHYYDRTQDNTFPYGLATPNRQGIGLDIDVETLKKKSLKIKGAVYLVQEISGNLVVNSGGTGFTGLDPTPSGATPVRKFTYVNVGPSFDLGPSVGLETPLEVGTNVRYEQTNSAVGTLTSTWLLGGLKIGIFPWWEVAAAYSYQTMNGSEDGINGLPLARYSYLFDNSDLGSYSVFNVDRNVQSLQFSTTFRVNRNSTIYLDYDLTQGTELLYLPLKGTVNNQYMEINYAIEF